MPTGTIRWFSAERDHGFIEPDGGGPEVFARAADIAPVVPEAFSPGVRVVYDVDVSTEAPEARRIQVI